MADVIDITSRFKKLPPAPTLEDIAAHAIDDITSNWEKFASNNRLNDYFLQCTPSWSLPEKNYLEDLGALSVMEQKIKMEPQTTSPGFSPDNALGWIAAFRMNGKVIATPFMLSECYARCFNILLYLKIKRELVTNKIPIL
jgi:hypothetical protein